MESWLLKMQYLLPLLLLFAWEVHCDCVLSKKDLDQCAGVITLNGELLRSNKIKKGDKLNVFPLDGGTPIKDIKCIDKKFSPPFPRLKRNQCNNKLLVVNDLAGHFNCQGTLRRVGYNIEGSFKELYRNCYDGDNYIARYSEGYVYPKTKESATRPQCTFTLDQIIPNNIANSLSRNEVAKNFQILYQSKYSIGKRGSQDNIDRGHLTPVDDYLTYAQKVATFKMINVIPQFHRFQASGGNWFNIEQHIRTLANRNYPRIFVKTGSYEVLKLSNSKGAMVPAYLNYNRRNNKWRVPVPAWVYKFVKTNKNIPIFASITYNNPFAKATPTAPYFCRPIKCQLKLSTNPRRGITYCCNPKIFQKHFF